MKSLILKDLYNIGHNAKSMIFILLVLAFALIPSSGVEGYIIMSGILCSMMIITTFSFDDQSKWLKYAMVMPVTKKDIVISKFIVLLIFSGIGAVTGLIIGAIGGTIAHKGIFSSVNNMLSLLFTGAVSLVLSEIAGSMSIPLLFKFGAEKARMLMLVSCLIPASIFFGIYKLFTLLGVTFTDQIIFILLCCSPFLALVWNFLMYKISYALFTRKELL
ncbi:ABC-2 transporter permease [Lacrimispora sphenoides]|uniref:ABC-2 family transporter protein n=1 Tax=Lacrimispora sphenoides JCM 1415 TaxID=1297793 RepID=A0ABY1C7R5_9FIRM|nr:ABC-2 transporter permease [Lacrimispora sphenoides]SET77996.1 ABC-2 family transporter protein [[Clostridium] sphenoides JCM 1415]SUY51207.1 ABC transporter permease [Lacrimispora sphenoides]